MGNGIGECFQFFICCFKFGCSLRHALLELVWRLVRWQPQYPPVRALVDGALSARQRRKQAVAAARRLAIDLWRLATGQCTPQQLQLDAAFVPA